MHVEICRLHDAQMRLTGSGLNGKWMQRNQTSRSGATQKCTTIDVKLFWHFVPPKVIPQGKRDL